MLMEDSKFRNSILKEVTKYFRDKIYTSYKCMKGIDTAGSTISFSGLATVRGIHTGGKKYVGKAGAIIPSTTELQKCSKVIEDFGRSIVPYHVTSFPPELGGGEIVRFDLGEVSCLFVGVVLFDSRRAVGADGVVCVWLDRGHFVTLRRGEL